ncbi:MAG: DUF4105 domain-containing protein [Sideroxydans sp.]|nr:DUF4105 domain-containing protein [Sideroxydans sp.]
MLLQPAAVYAATDSAYLAQLQAQARQMKLAERPEWRKLMHYVPRLIAPGYKGLVDSPQFYLAADGKTDPQAELDATLTSFYSNIEETATVQNPQCAFIARYTWLDTQLKFDAARLPPHTCKRYENWHASLNPSGLTLIFASAYMNNPSSMYGHTFLRVDAKDQDEHTRLLAYSVNFAANTGETNGFAFAVNGLFGGYAGAFSMLPYYAKVREYSDFENRDIWEYHLRLTPEEIDRVLMHAWELGPQYFDYFFFDENCSYHLLGLLQVARPEFEFTENFRRGAIPSDTVREITSHPGLVERTVFRPSNATLLRNRFGLMATQDRNLVLALSRGQIADADPALLALPLAREAAVLETSLDYINYRQVTGHHDVADPAQWVQTLQTARSRLDIITPQENLPEPETKPDQGHSSSRITLGAGRRAAQNFQEVQVRATYHDLMDQDAGYVRGAGIEFFSMTLRHYDSAASRVESFVPVNILSISPRDEFFHSPSWHISGGWQRVKAVNGSEPLATVLDGGMGGAWSITQNAALAYAFCDTGMRFSGALNKAYALGIGASSGSYIDLSPAWRVHPYFKTMRYFAGQQDSTLNLGLEQRIALSRNLALRADVARLRELKKIYNTAAISLLLYF